MNKPIALLINDIHVSKDNIADFKLNWDEALEICRNNNIDHIVIGGDMFTSRSSQTLATLLAVRDALRQASLAGLSVTLAAGNHDKVDENNIESYVHIFEDIPQVYVIDDYDVASIESGNFLLLVMSYFPESGSFLGKLDEAMKEVAEKYPQYEKSDIILYIHEGIHGALGDYEIEGELPQEPFLDFKAVLCGHYHNRVKIKDTNIEYIGSSRQHNFGEDEEKGYTILYSDGSYTFVKNEVNTRFKTVELDMADLDSHSLSKDPRYKYRAKLKCTAAQASAIDRQRLIDLGYNKVEVVAKDVAKVTAEATEINEKYDKQGLCVEYQNYCDNAKIDSALGLEYLKKQR